MKSGAVELRRYTAEDHVRTFAWLQDPETRRMTGTTAAPTPETHRRWFETMMVRADFEMWAVDFEGTHVGSVYLADIDQTNRRAEIQMFIGPTALRGMGIGKKALGLILSRAFKELGLHRVYGWPFEYNVSSLRMLEANGFRVEGILRDHRIVDGRPVNVLAVGVLSSDV